MNCKPKLYFISGTMCTPELWSKVQSNLSAYNCMYVDTTLATSFIEIDAMLDSILSKNAFVVAFSMGGYAALHFAITYPKRIAKLMIIAVSANGLSKEELQLRKNTIEFLETHKYSGISKTRVLQFLHPKNYQNKELIQIIKQMDATLGKEVLIKQLKATSQRVSLLEQLAGLENPIHIIASVEDKLVPINAVRKMQSKMPNATLTIVDNSGHMLPLESPEIIQDSIREFFN